MKTYEIILEGVEFDKGYFIRLDVLGETKDEAVRLALGQAHMLNLKIVGVESCDIIERSEVIHQPSTVLSISGKSFF